MVEEEETSFPMPSHQNDDFISYLTSFKENSQSTANPSHPHSSPQRHLKVIIKSLFMINL